MTPEGALALLSEVTLAWVEDPQSDAVWAGEYEGRWGVRLRQQTRDATTVWFDVGELTIRFEAYLLPVPSRGEAAVYEHCLRRNHTSWPATVSIDRDGDLYIVGRLALHSLVDTDIEQAVGAVYETVELSFQPLVRAGFRSREK